MSLTPEQLERYARHIMLRELGGPGQQRLLNAHVAIVGLGALGGPAALNLAAAGVGKLTLIDDDDVSLSNLQRQTLFRSGDVGRAKIEIAVRELAALNADCKVVVRNERLTTRNATDLASDADCILDGTDSFASRYAINEAAHALKIPMVSGAVGRWSAQVSVFRSGETRGQPLADRLPCYRCFVSEPPETEETCEAVGVVGPLTGMIGSRLALEAIKEVTGAGESIAGKVWLFDGLSGDTRTVKLRPDPHCPVCGD